MAQSLDKSNGKKPKLVRDSFSIPKAEYAAIETLKTRAMGLGSSVKKSELLRAGLMLLQKLSDSGFKKTLSAVPTLKTGRPTAQSVAAPAKPARPTLAKPVAPTNSKLSDKPAPKKHAPAAPSAPTAVQPVRPQRKTVRKPTV